MTEKEYKKVLKDGQKFLNKAFADLLAGKSDALHPAISQKAKDLILTELARFRNYKSIEIEYQGDRGAGREQDYKVIVSTETEKAIWNVSIRRGLVGVRWQFFVLKPNLEKTLKIKKKQVEKKTDKKVNESTTKENRGTHTRGTGKTKGKAGKGDK